MFLPESGNLDDWNAFVEFCESWLCQDPNDACYDPAYDHNNDDIVNFADFTYFASQWEMPSGTESHFYYLTDALGSVRGLVGGMYNREPDREFYNYEVYGNPSGGSLPSVTENPYLFAGYRCDSETGLYYLVNRTYDPTTGRFIQFDPIGYADSMNLYEYVKSNPTNFIDPKGTEAYHVYTPFDAFGQFLFGGGEPAKMSQYYLDSFLWHRPDGYLEGLDSIKADAKNKAVCGKRIDYIGKTEQTEVPAIDIRPVPAEYNIPIPKTMKDTDVAFALTFGSIDKIYYDYSTTVTCDSVKTGQCCCNCTVKSSVKVKLEDTYHFQGSNNKMLKWLDKIGTDYLVTGEFVDYVEDNFNNCNEKE
jgi:RHS repeat-associated protein